MKRKRGLARALAPLSREALEAMPTGALLARLKHLRWCEDARGRSDLSKEEIASATGLILFKEEPAWSEAYADLKAVLAGREHVGNKP